VYPFDRSACFFHRHANGQTDRDSFQLTVAVLDRGDVAEDSYYSSNVRLTHYSKLDSEKNLLHCTTI
jgi:hypothetical protein